MQLLQQNIALVYSPSKREISSGYLLANGIVATCLHGLLETTAPATTPGEVTARVYLNGDHGQDDFAGGFLNLPTARYHEARLIWPLPGMPADMIDLALLEIIDKDASPHIAAATSGAVLDVARNDMRGHAVGYSGAWSDDDPRMRDLGRVVMETTDMDDAGEPLRAVDRYGFQRHVNVLEGGLNNREGWGGMSGAVIFASQQEGLIGVMKARGNKALTEDRLLFTPFSEVSQLNLPDVPDAAQTFWALSGLSPPQAERQTIDWDKVLEARFDTLGRSTERRWFKRLTKAIKRDPEAPAHVVLIMGHREEDLNQCARYLVNLATEFPEGDRAYSRPISVNLREGYEGDSERGLQAHLELRAETIAIEILKGLGLTESAAEDLDHMDRLAKIREELQQPSNPRALIFTHDQHRIHDDCFILSQRLAAFLGTLPTLSPPVLIFILFVTGNDIEGADLVEFEGKAKRIRDEITPCLAIQLDENYASEFCATSITPIPEASPEEWLDKLVEDAWLPEDSPALVTNPSMAGREQLSDVTESNVKDWLAEIPEVVAAMDELERARIAKAFESAPAPMRRAKERLKAHPSFRK